MPNNRKRPRSREFEMVRQHFEEEIRKIHIPPPPSIEESGAKHPYLLGHLQEAIAVVLTAACVALLITTAGNRTSLSREIEEAITQYNVRTSITGFLQKAGQIYRSESFGG